MTDQELDQMMKRILMDSIQLDLDVNENPSSFQPSPGHQRQMRSMLADPLKWSKRKTSPLWKTVLQRAALILLTLSLGFGMVMAGSPTARAAFSRLVKEVYESYIVYRYTGEPVSSDLPHYEITALPEGFVETERTDLHATELVIYENETGDAIYFSYAFMQQGVAAHLGTENSEVVPIVVNGFEGDFYQSKDYEKTNSTIVWIDTERNIQFDISGFFEYSDILHMAESVYLSNVTK